MTRRWTVIAAYLAGFTSCLVFVAYTGMGDANHGQESVAAFGWLIDGKRESPAAESELLKNGDGKDALFVASIQRLQKERQARLRTACSSVANRPDMLGTIFNVPDLGITYCCIAKCASTTFKSFLEVSTGKVCSDLDEHYCARKQFSMITSFQDFLPNSVIIVRNPWHRLVSAYIDKFANERIHFSKFCYDYHNLTFRGGPPVSFRQFVECVLNDVKQGRALNPHIAPVHWHCDPCHANYTYIATLESFGDDMDYLIKIVLPRNKTAGEYRKALGSIARRRSEQSNDTRLTYERNYASLSKQLLRRVVRLYRMDALLYGYPDHPQKA